MKILQGSEVLFLLTGRTSATLWSYSPTGHMKLVRTILYIMEAKLSAQYNTPESKRPSSFGPLFQWLMSLNSRWESAGSNPGRVSRRPTCNNSFKACIYKKDWTTCKVNFISSRFVFFCYTDAKDFITLLTFLADPLKTQFRTNLSRASYHGGITSWSEAIQYLLGTYATASNMRYFLEYLLKVK